jgi:hypothetical protein
LRHNPAHSDLRDCTTGAEPDRGDTPSGVFFDVENPMKVGRNRADGNPPATKGDHRRCGLRLTPPDRLRERRDETRLWSNPGTGRREQPSKGFRGNLLRNSLCGNGPNHPHRATVGRRLPGSHRDGNGDERTSKGKKAHGRSERCTAGNGGTSRRTRQRSKASKSADPSEGAERRAWQRARQMAPPPARTATTRRQRTQRCGNGC